MSILINTKEKKSNVVYIVDYLKKKQEPYIPFSDELAKLNKQIVVCNKETDIIDREIAEYQKKSEEAAERLKLRLFAAEDFNGKD